MQGVLCVHNNAQADSHLYLNLASLQWLMSLMQDTPLTLCQQLEGKQQPS